MTIQTFYQPRSNFLDPVRFGRPYRYHIILITNLIGVNMGKGIARYIRDHNFHQFFHSNNVIIRNAYRIYHYLFPENSHRRYFMEVILPDSLSIALHMEVYLRTASRPFEQAETEIEEAILTVARIFFFMYGVHKVRQTIYKILAWIPQRHVLAVALSFAPTGIYLIEYPNGETREYRN